MKARLFALCCFILLCCALFLALKIDTYSSPVSVSRLAKLEPVSLEQKVTLFLSNGSQLRYRSADEFEVVMAILRVESEYKHGWSVIRPSVDSPLGMQRSAFVTMRDGKYSVVLDGVRGKQYDGISSSRLLFSPNGKRFAYVAQTGGKYTLVLDGKEWLLLDGISYAAFTSDSKHVICIGETGKQKSVLFDGRPAALNPSPDIIRENTKMKWYLFTPDMPNSLGLDVVRDSVSMVIADRAGRLTYTPVREGAASPDGRRLAYTICSNNSCTLILDGRKQRFTGFVSHLQFSPDSRRFAYSVSDLKNNVDRVSVDGRMIGGFQLSSNILFSPDSRHYAYVARYKNHISVVVDGRQTYRSSGEYTNIESLTWSPDSRSLAYVDNGDGWDKVVRDGRAVFSADIVSAPVFSPDSRHIAYSGIVGDNARVMLDGKKYDSWKYAQDILMPATGALAFSQDGKHIAYTVDNYIVLDKKKGPAYDFVFDWIPGEQDYKIDGRTVILQVLSEASMPGTYPIRTVSSTPRTFFDSPAKVSYLAVKDGWINLIEQGMK
ncbi:MAG: hypothetical protein ACYC27_13910 [Armatimonadota bacterium]